MKHRLLLLAALVLAVAVAAPTLAEESTVDQAQEDPAGVTLSEGTRLVDDGEQSSIVRAFHEKWEDAPTIEEAGWSQEYVEEPSQDAPEDYFRHVHRKDDNPHQAPRATPIVAESQPHAVTTMRDSATYVGQEDARLISPVLDLRYVRGIAGSTSEAHRNEDVASVLADLSAAYGENHPDQYLFTAGYHELLFNPPSEWFPLPCPQDAPAGCGVVADGYADGRSGGEAFEEQERDLPRECQGFESVPFFGAFIEGPEQCTPQQSVPIPGTRDFGLYADEEGQVYAPNPVDEREGLTYVNVTFWHKWDLSSQDAVYLEVRERTADGSWSDWRPLEPDEAWNQPNTNPSSEFHQETSGERTLAYNGWFDDHRAFVGSSDGLVASTFNLNRFADTEIQLAWRSSSVEPSNRLGWFIDDVVLWTNTYEHDVGIRDVDRPDEGDRVAPGEPARPSATVRNYGHLPTEDVKVTFRVTPPDDTGESLWSDSQVLDRLDPQEEVEVAATEAFDPEAHLEGDPTGSYRLVANVTPYAAPDDPTEENLTHRPETSPWTDNNERVVPFQVQAKAQADVAIDVPRESVQTDVGDPKTFAVRMENTGNLPLFGPVEVTATRLNRTTLQPADDARVIERVQVQPGELPYGEDLTSFGTDANTWTRSFRWTEGLETPGIYRLRASLESPEGSFDGTAPVYVRATPAPYYQEDAEDLLDLSFSDESVYSTGMRLDLWETTVETTASGGSAAIVSATTGLPDPVSPDHVWYGRGDDGGVGADRYGNTAEEAAGSDLVGNGTYDDAEPDSNAQTRDRNYVDHYWLTREVNLTAYDSPDTDLVLTFWHTGEFNWSGRASADHQEVDRSRGRIEVLPQDNAFLTDPAEGEQEDLPGTPSAETGFDAVDSRTPSDRNVTLVSGDAIYAQALDSWDSPVPWTRERVDLTPWKGQEVTLRFHLETSASRQAVNGSDTGELSPWLVDNVQLEAREGDDRTTVFSTDVEGDDWERWSSSDGVRVEDPRSPVAVAQSPGDKVVGSSLEGRGWDRFGYGETTLPSGWHLTDSRTRPEAGTEVQSSMFRWGDPDAIGDELPKDVNLSILSTPEFRLDDARDPVVRFLHNHTFPNPSGLTDSDWFPHEGKEGLDHVIAGGSVWIVGEDEDGQEVKRELLVPTEDSEARYDAPIANWYTENKGGVASRGHCDPIESGGESAPGGNELHCETPLRDYPTPEALEAAAPAGAPAETQVLEGNVFTGKSGLAPGERGPSQWEQAVLDLSPYTEDGNASLDYHIEFHAINQRTDQPDGLGWLVDDVEITERTFANDVAVDEIVRPADRTVGPGLQKTVALRVQNQGLYDQSGVEASYRVLDASGEVVFEGTAEKTSPGKVIPGARNSDNPDKNETVVFGTNWPTPREEGTYVIEGEVSLEDAIAGNAFPDANPSNDVLRREIQVESSRSVGILGAEDHPTPDVVDPFVGTDDTRRTFTVKVENKGTLPEDFSGNRSGDFNVELTVRRASGEVVRTQTAPISRLEVGETKDVTFRGAWKPDATGVYEVSFELSHPNETVAKADHDNVRTFTYTVFNEILSGGSLEDLFRSEDAGWTFQDGSWVFGHGEEYRNDADDALVLEDPLDIQNLQQGVVRLNHSYGFEAGYDGARLEVKPVDGDTWYPVPPQGGYPTNMSSGSPFVDEPGGITGALSGTSGGGDEPATEETAFDLAGVDPLVIESTIFDEDFENASLVGTSRPDSVRYGDWSSTYLSRVTPHSGDRMFHSNDTVVVSDCWRFFYEHSEGSADPERECDPGTLYDSRKYLNVTFDDDFPADRDPLSRRLTHDDVDALQVSYWDRKAIGLTQTSNEEDTTDLETENEVSVHLTCVGDGCPEGATRTLDPVDPDSYDNNYRGWTRNVFEIPESALDPYTGPGKALRLSFVHHVMNGDPGKLRSTDARSLHAGWFVDDVELGIVQPDGEVDPYWSDDMEEYERGYLYGYPSNRTGEEGRKEFLKVGPWDGTSFTYQDPDTTICGEGPSCWMPRLLWDPIDAWGGEAFCLPEGADEEVRCEDIEDPDVRENASERHGLWRHVDVGELPCGPLAHGAAELADELQDPENYPSEYEADSTHLRACGPTGGQRERAGGDRLVTEVNLRPAVGDVTLSFDHEYRFLHTDDDPMEGRSGGRLEASVDGGETWIPLQPVSNDTRPMDGENETEETAQFATHTTLGGVDGDPEGDSIYGIGGQGWTGVSGVGDPGEPPEPETAVYDLSRFSGRKVQLAWHAYFGTHNRTTSNVVDTISGAYEYWAVQNVSVDAEVLDAERLDMRLRAATDASKTDEGWTVNDVTMAGTNTDVNVAGEVRGLPEDAPVEAGEQGFSVALANKGQETVRVDATVRVVRETDAGGSLVFEANESQIRLEPKAVLEQGALGGEDLVVPLEDGETYGVEIDVEIVDPDTRRREAIRADNRDRVVLDEVLGGSTLEVDRLRATPNTATGTGDEAIRVEAVVLNDGFGSPAIQMSEFGLDIRRVGDDEPALSLRDEDALAEDPGQSFREPFQTKTYAWVLSPEQIRDLPAGVYDVELQMNPNTEAPDPAPEEVEPLYVGPSFFEEQAYKQEVRAGRLQDVGTCQYTNQDARSPGGGGGGSEPPPTSPTWTVSSDSNESRPRSFAWPAFGVPQIDRGAVTCAVEEVSTLGSTLRDNLHVHYWTRFRFNDEAAHFNVTTGLRQECDTDNVDDLPTAPVVPDLRSETPSFNEDEYLHGSVPFRLDEEDSEGGTTGCVAFEARNDGGEAYVDDITVSPYQVELTPEVTAAQVSDNTVKRFPFNVTNEGAFNDTYEFALVDATGTPSAGPRSWDFHVETPSGQTVERVSLAAGESRELVLVADIPVQGVSTSGTAEAALSAISHTDDVIRDVSKFVFRFDYPPRPNLDVISASVNNPDLSAGSPRSVTVTVANVGVETAEEVPVEIVDRMPPRFGVPPTSLTTVDGQPLPNVTLEPGQTTTLIAGWTPTRAGPHNLTIHVDPSNEVVESDEEDNVELLEVPVESARFPDLVVDLETSDDEPEAGSEIDVNATITNEGEAPAQGVQVTFRVGVSDLLDGEAPHILSQIIEPGETVRLDASWPASFPGDYKAFVKAIPLSGALEPSDTQDDNLDSADVTVRSPGLQVEGPEAAVNASQGEEVLAPVTIENRGDTDETVDVTASAGDPLRARVVQEGVSVTRVDVPEGNATELGLQVRAPSQAVADTYPVTVTVVSTQTGQTERVEVPVRIEAERGLALEATAVDVDPGGGSLPVTVTNTGNVPATVNVSARDLPDTWSVDAQTTLEPFSSQTIQADLHVPTDAPAGVRDIVVTASAREAQAGAPVRVEVGTRGVLDVGLDPADVALRPGSTVTFNATLESVGNVPANTDLRVDAPDSWDVDLPRPRAQIPDGESLAFPITAEIPEGADAGDRALVLVAEGEEEDFVGGASVTVGIPDATVTNVEQNPRVNIEGGQDVTFGVTVRNTGGLALDETGVAVYVDDALMDFGTVTDVDAGGKEEVDLEWTAEPGEHVLLIVADPSERITEADEGNNARLLVLQVGGDGVQVASDVRQAVPVSAGLGLVALLGAAVARRWAT